MKVVFIMLNPSTADGTQDDATIRKLMGYMRRWYPERCVGEVERAALVSACERYRYRLSRTWRSLHGYAELVVVNLFAWRATEPAELWMRLKCGDEVVGETVLMPLYWPNLNDRHIRKSLSLADHVIAAWGTDRRALARAKEVEALVAGASCPLEALAVSHYGRPKHPLYLPGDLRPTAWRRAA